MTQNNQEQDGLIERVAEAIRSANNHFNDNFDPQPDSEWPRWDEFMAKAAIAALPDILTLQALSKHSDLLPFLEYTASGSGDIGKCSICGKWCIGMLDCDCARERRACWTEVSMQELCHAIIQDRILLANSTLQAEVAALKGQLDYARNTHYAWLIEIRDENGKPSWLSDYGFTCFTTNAWEALHFRRKQDAEHFADADGSEYQTYIVEHGFQVLATIEGEKNDRE